MTSKNDLEMEQREPLVEQCTPEFFKFLFKIDHDPNTRRKKVEDFNRIGGQEGILEKLKTNKTTGLSKENESDHIWRSGIWGTNKKNDILDRSYFEHVMDSLNDQMLQILLAAAAVSLVIGILKDGIQTGWIEGTAIFFAVFIVVNITAYMNSTEEKEFNKLNKLNRTKEIELIRDNHPGTEDTEKVLVGDIINYRIGDLTDVDAIMIENFGIEVDESSLTGESKEIKKNMKFNEHTITSGPFIASGCSIKKGSCRAVVVCVGEHTLARQAEQDIDNTKETPLQEKLDKLKDKISNLGYFVAILIGIVMVLKEILLRWYQQKPLLDSSSIDVIVNAFIISITVLVVALPEGLPMAVTLSLVHSMKKMKDENNLVKYIDSSETMGNVNELCSDKTGTLTTGEMILSRAFLLNTDYVLEKNDSTNILSNTKIKSLGDFELKHLDFLNLNIINNMTKYTKNEENKYVVHGSMTDQGYMNFINKFNYNISKYEAYQKDRKDLIKVDFSSDEKFMASSVYLEKSKKYRILVKGAFDFFRAHKRFGYVLSNVTFKNPVKDCNNFWEQYTLETVPFDQKNVEGLEAYIKLASENCLRSIFFGYKDIPKGEYESIVEEYKSEPLLAFNEFIRKDLVVSGLMSFYDPPRDNIQTSIARCLGAGVNLRMITGDDLRTAVSISYKIGILSESQYRDFHNQEQLPKEPENPTDEELKVYQEKLDKYYNFLNDLAINNRLYCLDGSTFNRLTQGLRINPAFNKKEDISDRNQPYELVDEARFERIVKNLRVIARCANDNKLLLVLGLKKLRNIVAVTGDGTNDAIALKNSDVGFAMGIRGTAVAKSAADIILLDDSFNSIITAIKYGRNVFDSIRKFVQFQITTNIVAIFMTLLGGIILKDSPLNPIQMLWVNLIMDSFASLALATEPPSEDLLKRKPYSKNTDIITPMMKVNIVSQAIFQIVVLLIIIFFGDIIFNVPSDRELEHYTWNADVGYHFTIFFNIFVFLQVFNSINSRKLMKKDANVFIGITNNPLYLSIQGIIIAGQILLVQFGSRAVRTQPLTIMQHLGCLAIGSISLILGYVVKKIPFDLEQEDAEAVKGKYERKKSRISAFSRNISGKTRT